ncbi:hypothetical protein KOW79_021721 [Hemibagrus wyckioides]|uniref:IGFBP N-terminal domain-containing protein n=1 Tax=Hemibagrus wyckioides TaxID=337641 RepID=A0A9D3SC04_9TELE|nr:hypothetical protein KOW79_021721 [Hemibagrus wyckioides]
MMYLKGLMISQFLVVLVVRCSSTFVCEPCSSTGCPELKCLGGKVLGACGCCYVCAKQLGEKCGGLYGLIGICDQGLRCLLPPQEVNVTVTIIYHVGVCQGGVDITPGQYTSAVQGGVDITPGQYTSAVQGGVDITPGQYTSTVQDSSDFINVTTHPVPKLENGVSSSLRIKEVQILCLIMSLICLYCNFSNVIK